MKNKSISSLKSHIGYLMRLVSNNVSRDFANQLNHTGVTVAEWVIMRILFDHDYLTHAQLMDLSGLTKGAISKNLNKLYAKQFIQKKEMEHDARSQAITLSEKAINILPSLAKLADGNDATYFSILTKKEQSMLKKILNKIIQLKTIIGTPID
jgi:DNA-binding MarR family transcriptional regulator